MVGVIGAVGFLAGRISSPSAEEDARALAGDSRTERTTARVDRNGEGAAGQGARTAPERNRQESADQRRSRIEAIMRGENSLDRNRALLSFIDGLAPHEFEDAVAHFRSLGLTESRMGEYSLLLAAWAKLDPTTALAYTAENTRGDFATHTVLTAWASLDPDSAVRWAQANHEGDGPNRHMIGVIRGIAENDPNLATTLLQEMPRSNSRGEALAAMMPHVLKNGPQAARDWVAMIGDDALRNGAIDRFARPLAAVDPPGTVDWLLANPGETSRNRIDDVFGSWANQDRDAALRSFQTLPAGPERTYALAGMAGALAAAGNPQEAMAMVDRFPADVNDRVINDVVRNSIRQDPSFAASQIARMADEGMRNRAYRQTLDRWIDNDPTGAQAWIQNNALPDSVWNHVSRRLAQQ